jgi:GNAT superfamily N-acetyltransferase
VEYVIREAATADIRDLVALRRAMFEAMGYDDAVVLDRMCDASASYFAERLPTGAFRAWVAEVDGRPIASIGLVTHSVPPSPRRLVGKEAYIMNLVTLPGFRRQGIAAALLDQVLTVARSEGIPVASLHATAAGRGIYEQAGFRSDGVLPEMRRTLGDETTT